MQFSIVNFVKFELKIVNELLPILFVRLICEPWSLCIFRYSLEVYNAIALQDKISMPYWTTFTSFGAQTKERIKILMDFFYVSSVLSMHMVMKWRALLCVPHAQKSSGIFNPSDLWIILIYVRKLKLNTKITFSRSQIMTWNGPWW